MNKKQVKILVVFLALLAAGIIALVVLNKDDKKEESSSEENTETEYILSEEFRKIKDFTVRTKTDEIDFHLYNDKWIKNCDDAFPIDNEKVSLFASMLKEMKKLREIKDYDTLDDFKLSDPAMTVDIELSNDDVCRVKFSDYEGNSNVYYVMVGDNVYLTDSTIYKFAKYTLLDYCAIPEMPEFTPGSIKSITVDVKNGNKIELVPGEKKATEGDAGEWYYYVSSDGETVNDKKLCDQGDANVFFNYLTELTYNRVLDYNVSDQRKAFYGTAVPETVVTIQFKGYTSVTNETDAGQNVDQMLDTDFTYKFLIGNEIKESDGEYYITNTCVDSVASDNIFDGKNCMFATNSYYAKFFIGLTKDSLNGVNSSKD